MCLMKDYFHHIKHCLQYFITVIITLFLQIFNFQVTPFWPPFSTFVFPYDYTVSDCLAFSCGVPLVSANGQLVFCS